VTGRRSPPARAEERGQRPAQLLHRCAARRPDGPAGQDGDGDGESLVGDGAGRVLLQVPQGAGDAGRVLLQV